MADKPKPKSAPRTKAKAVKSAEAKTAKSAEATPVAAKKAGKTTKATVSKTASKPVSKPAKAKSGKTADASPAAKKSKPAPSVETYFVCMAAGPIEIRDTQPTGETRHVEFSSFAAARNHLLEELIASIEEYERVLHAVRGAIDFAEYLDRQQFGRPELANPGLDLEALDQ